MLIESDAPAEAIVEVERTMRLNEDIMRYMSLREDELSEGPSIMMSKNPKTARAIFTNEPLYV